MAPASLAETARPLHRASLGALFREFFKVSLFGFGGGIVMAHRAAVERRRWLSESDFADIVILCQFMPGPNVVGIAVCTGAKTLGLPGALAAFAGFVLVPGALGFSLALLYLGQTGVPAVQNILAGISPAAAGLMIGTGLRMLKPHRRNWPALAVAALAFAGLAIFRFPLPLVLLTLAPLSLGLAVFNRARSR